MREREREDSFEKTELRREEDIQTRSKRNKKRKEKNEIAILFFSSSDVDQWDSVEEKEGRNMYGIIHDSNSPVSVIGMCQEVQIKRSAAYPTTVFV